MQGFGTADQGLAAGSAEVYFPETGLSCLMDTKLPAWRASHTLGIK